MFRTLLAGFISLIIVSSNTVLAADDADIVNIYSSRKEKLIKPLLDQFTQKTGIKTHLLTSKADALIQRLKAEGKNSPADILLTVDAGRLHRAKTAGLLQTIHSKILTQRIPEHLRDRDSQWFGLSARARVIMYNKNKVSAAELSTYENLDDQHWHGRICVRSSNNIYNQSLVASMIASNGEQAAEKWAAGIVNNMARLPKGNDRAQIAAVAIGECDITLANTYYLAYWLQSDDAVKQQQAKTIGVYFPNQKDRGAHINISGAGVTKAAKHKAAAIQLLEFLSSDEAQSWYAKTNNEYPVVKGANVSNLVKSWGYPFKADTLNLTKLGELNATAVKVFDRAGWR